MAISDWEYKYNPTKGGDWPFQVKMIHLVRDPRVDVEIYHWCKKTFPKGTWYNTITTYNFKNREDAEFFMLRWS